MLESIKHYVKSWDWKLQSISDMQIPVLLGRLESNYYKTQEIDFNIENIDLSSYTFTCNDLFDFATHLLLVEKANLKYPIIINRRGRVLDGRHRIMKAILEGRKTIKAIQILDADVIE